MYKVLLLLLPILLFSKFQVTTTFPFEAQIIKRIAKNNVRIKTISNTFLNNILKFTSSEIENLSQTKVYFNFSLEVEEKYEKIFLKKNPNLNIVSMSRNIKKLKYNGKDNPYIWLDPILLRDVAKNIYETFIKIDSFNKQEYLKNYEEFLSELDNSFLDTLKKLQDSEVYNIFVFDETFDYFAKRFKINIFNIEDRILYAEEIKGLMSFVKKNNIKAIFIQKQKNIVVAKSLAGYTNISIKSYDIYDELISSDLSKITDNFQNTK